MKRIDRIVELAGELGFARAEVQRLEGELEAMLGKPGKPGKPAAEAKPAGSEGNGTGKVKRGERMAQVAELAKNGLSIGDIAKQLGISYAAASITLKRARKNHLAPKAEAAP